MAGAFPKLKTDAIAQYPAVQQVRFANQVLQFVDGSEQRYRDSAGPLRRWQIRLDQLDDGEMAALEQFFAASQGRFGTFDFTDPWDATVHSNCTFATDELGLLSVAEMKGRISITVVENRG